MWDASSQSQSLGGSKPSTAPAATELEPLEGSMFLTEATSLFESEADGELGDEDLEDLPAKLERTIKRLQQVNGVWDPQIWIDARKAIVRRNRTDGLAALFQCVRVTTEWALQRSAYRMKTQVRHCTGHVDLAPILPKVRHAYWYGRANVEVPWGLQDSEIGSKKTPPPLIFTELEPLEVVAQLRKLFGNDRQITLVTDITDFEESGDIELWRQKGMVPHCLPLRSDFSLYAAEAKLAAKGGDATMRQHLCATQDPYLFFCPSVTIFRGPQDDGYPFLEDPFRVHVLASSMPPGRPPIQTVSGREGPTSWYAYKNDHNALVERYNLLALVGYQASDEGARAPPHRRD